MVLRRKRGDATRALRSSPAAKKFAGNACGVLVRERMYRERRRACNIGSGWRSRGRGSKGVKEIEEQRSSFDLLPCEVLALEKRELAPALQRHRFPPGAGAGRR